MANRRKVALKRESIDATRDILTLKTRGIIHSEHRVENNFIMGKNDQQEKQPSGKPSTEAVGSALQPKADNGIQEWFATLSIEERAGALGFSDGAILRVLLDYASLASPFASKLEANPESRTDKKGEINIIYFAIRCLRTFFSCLATPFTIPRGIYCVVFAKLHHCLTKHVSHVFSPLFLALRLEHFITELHLVHDGFN